MKKLIGTFTLAIVAFLFIPSLIAQNTNGSTSGGIIIEKGNWPIGPHTPPICYDMYDFPNGFPVGQNINLGGKLKSGVHPDMYATFTVDIPALGQTVIEHLLIPNDSILFLEMVGGDSIFGAYMVAMMDLSFLCDDPYQSFPGNYTLELTTAYGGVHVPYPISTFSGPGDIFDDAVFDINSGVETGTKNFCCYPPSTKSIAQIEELVESTSPVSLADKNKVQCHFNNNGADGQIKYANSLFNAHVSPNPFKDQFTLSVQLATTQNIGLEILSLQGEVIYRSEERIDKGISTVQFNTIDFPSGIYFLKLMQNDDVHMIKMIK